MKFSNAFINQLDKKSKIFDYQISNKSIEILCRRNNTNLVQFIFDKAIKSTSSYDILEQCIQIFIDNNNFKIAKKFLDFVKKLKGLKFNNKISEKIKQKIQHLNKFIRIAVVF